MSGPNPGPSLALNTTQTLCRTPARVPVGSPSSCTATVTDSTPTSASAPSGTVSFTADVSSSAFASCTLGGASTNTLTMAVSTSCAVSYTPTVVGPHTITASYGGDASHLGSSGAFVVTALKHRSEERRVGKEGRSRGSPYH